ncbi:MAG: hypothetical protein K2G87_05910 [Oscillospiraceae bacterium]|nr:hypothetical protein [Oscillospiraceae bacterium]
MIRNVSSANSAVVNNTTVNKMLEISDEYKKEFVKAMKIGYYKEFFKQGLITAEQLEQLIAMQDKSVHSAA